jgi:PAS domain S-box-containing protein
MKGEELEKFFSLSLDFLCIAGIDGYFKRVSPAVTDILGWTVDELLATPYLELVHPEDRDATAREVERQSLEGERVMRFENRYLHKDGSWRMLSWRSMPQPDGLMYATARDVTEERHSAQRKLQSRLEHLSLLQHITHAIGERQDSRSIYQVVASAIEEQMPAELSAVFTYDAAHRELIVECVGCRGLPLARELGLIDRARIEVDVNGLSRCLQGHLIYEPDLSQTPFPLPRRLAIGALRAMIVAPMLVENEMFGILLACRREPESFTSEDCEFLQQLSEHVALAANHAQLYAALQRAYEDLRQSQQAVMQQERLRALGQMASGIAHDINNAISPVALYTESLLEFEHNLTAKGREYLRIIDRAVGDVAKTVERMREFARQREPQTPFAPIDVNRVAQQVLDLTRARWSDMANQRGVLVEIETELAADLSPVRGAESEIREALTNLVFNALDAMPVGGTLTLRTLSAEPRPLHERRKRRVSIEVADTGIGMNEDTRRRCLEPFFSTKGERGTGLGLPMVYGIVERHGGDLEIDSVLGGGTTVRITLNCTIGAAGDTSPDLLPTAPLPPLRILVVDDDPTLRQSLRNILESDGHSVRLACGGREGIEEFAAARTGPTPFDVVITDLGMPHVDGLKVASGIKALTSSTPVILLTGWGQGLIEEEGPPPNVDYVLGKPPKVRDLREALRSTTATAPVVSRVWRGTSG